MPTKYKPSTKVTIMKLAKKLLHKFKSYAALQMLMAWVHDIADGWL